MIRLPILAAIPFVAFACLQPLEPNVFESERNGGLALAVTDFSDDYELTPSGALPDGYTLLSGTAEVAEATQSNGLSGHVLRLTAPGSGSRALVRVDAAGQRGEVELGFDVRGEGNVGPRILVRALDADNGYELALGSDLRLELSRIEAGVRTMLATGDAARDGQGWRRFRIEARGDVIRVTDGESMLLQATDDTFSSGYVLLGVRAHSIGVVALFDNVSVTAPAPATPARLAVLPLFTGFEDLEPRDGVLQHPNLDLVEGSISYRQAVQPDGIAGGVMQMHASSVVGGTVAIESGSLADVGVELDALLEGATGLMIFFRAIDPLNGYALGFSNFRRRVGLYRVEAGDFTLLALADVPPSGSDWLRLGIEARGDEILVTDGEGPLLAVTDETFPSGRLFLRVRRSTLGRTVSFDNLVVETLVPPTPEEIASELSEDLGSLEAAGSLTTAETVSLGTKLDAAVRQIEQGNDTAAARIMRAFVQQLEAMVAAGRLTEAQVRPLIDLAEAAIDQMV